MVIYNALFGHIKNSTSNVLSSVGFPEFKSQLADLGYNMLTSILQPSSYKQVIGNRRIYDMLKYKEWAIRHGGFNNLLNNTFFKKIDNCKKDLKELLQNYAVKGVFLYTDEYFESKLLIDVAKEIKIPTFDFLHGLPGIYSLDVDSHTDYLMVWGNKIKRNYIDAGFDAEKIIVVGNSKYGKYVKQESLRNTLSDILVIPVSSILWHQHQWGKPELIDRSMAILYLYKVQHVLKQLNIRHARFRVHPSINADWVYNFLDTDFWIKDNLPLSASLQKSSIVIGATSSVFLEALMNGVNYIVFEPQEEGLTLIRSRVVPPFDGKDEKLHVAFDENDLYSMLREKYTVDSSILDDYMQPLDLSPLRKLILS